MAILLVLDSKEKSYNSEIHKIINVTSSHSLRTIKELISENLVYIIPKTKQDDSRIVMYALTEKGEDVAIILRMLLDRYE